MCVSVCVCVCVCVHGASKQLGKKRKLSQAIVTGQNNGTMPNATKPHVHAYMSTYIFSARCNRYLQR